MDFYRHKILVVLVFFMAIRHIMTVVVVAQQLAIGNHYGAMTIILPRSLRATNHENVVFECMKKLVTT